MFFVNCVVILKFQMCFALILLTLDVARKYFGAEFVCDEFRIEKKATALTISSPLESINAPSSTNNERLHLSPAVTDGTKQPVGITVSSPTFGQHQRLHERISPPCTNNAEYQLAADLPQSREVPQYSQPTSNSRTSPTHGPALQQPAFTSHVDVDQMLQPVQDSSTNQITSGSDEPVYSTPMKQHRIHEPVSPPFASNKERQLPANSPPRQHVQQRTQQVSHSQASPSYGSSPQQPTGSLHGDISRMSQAIRGTSPNQMTPNEPVYSSVIQRSAPSIPFVPPAEQHVYTRPSLSLKHVGLPVSHQPAVKNGVLRHPTSASRGLDSYHQQIPPVTPPKFTVSTSAVDGMYRDQSAGRSRSWREQPPVADYEVTFRNIPPVQTQRSNSQREMFAVRNEQGQYGDRMLPFGNGPSPGQQNIQLKDPYRLHRAAVDGAYDRQRDRVRAESVLSQDRDIDMKNRLRSYAAENAYDNTAVGVPGIPASYRYSPTVSGQSQSSVPAYHGQLNNDLCWYPPSKYVVRHSVNPQPLPPNDYQLDDLRNPSIEHHYNSRSRQVRT